MEPKRARHLNITTLRCIAAACALVAIVNPVGAAVPAAAASAPMAPGLTDLGGATTDLGRYRGHIVLLNFWATWCSPCREEMPALNRLYGQLDARRAVIIGVAADDRAMVAPFVAKLGIRYPIVVGNPDQLYAWTASLGNVTQGLPFSVLLDGHGKVRWIESGTLNMTEVRRRIGQLLADQRK